jgi:pimeloyl-ACP methyl ester carboxylesterase
LVLSTFVFLIVFVLTTSWRATVRERTAEAAYPPTGEIVTVDGVRMHAQIQGNGPDLVLIHGSSGSLRDFNFGLMAELSRSWRVIAVDRPGLGWSDAAPGTDTISRQAALIRKTAAHFGADMPVVLGQSYGGAVALAWAVEAPDSLSALVTVSTPSHPWVTGLSMFYRLTAHPVGQAILVPLLSAFVPAERLVQEVNSVFAPQTAPHGYAEHFGPGMTLRRKTLRANARQRAQLLHDITALSQRYNEISIPVEIVHGDADPAVGLSIHAQRFESEVSSASLTVLKGIGHMPHHSAVSEVVAAAERATNRAGLRQSPPEPTHRGS